MVVKDTSKIPLEKVTLNLRAGDWEWLMQMYPYLGAGRVIRNMVMAIRQKVEDRAAQTTLSPTDLDLIIEDVDITI